MNSSRTKRFANVYAPLPIVVEKQLREIRPSKVQQFRYVPSAKNPADMASRGASLKEIDEKQWLQPQWLENLESWPQMVSISEKDMEEESETFFIQMETVQPVPALFGIEIEKYLSLIHI